MKKMAITLLGVWLGLHTAIATAGSSSGQFTTSLNLESSCTAPALNMLPYSFQLGALPAEVEVGIVWFDAWCTFDIYPSVGVGGGDHYGMATPGMPAVMNGAGDYIAYRFSSGGITPTYYGDGGISGIAPGYVETNSTYQGLFDAFTPEMGGPHASFSIAMQVNQMPVGTYTDTVQIVVAWP